MTFSIRKSWIRTILCGLYLFSPKLKRAPGYPPEKLVTWTFERVTSDWIVLIIESYPVPETFTKDVLVIVIGEL